MAPEPENKSPNFRVEPPAHVMAQIEARNTSVDTLIEEAKLAVLDMQGDETAVARYFIQRGYDDDFANWLGEEAKAREPGLDANRVEPAETQSSGG